MVGRRLGHFEILDQLGEGGMGIVYKARDTRLDRLVAIKILPSDQMADKAKQLRFVQEAKAASALQHPGIVTIHDINTENDVTYIAMEYVRGQTLTQWIRSGRHDLKEVLKYAAQIASALATAHAHGIVHRDVKPGNIMIAGDQAKLLDFGLVKLLESARRQNDATLTVDMNEEPKTGQGMIVGTAAYMSPEQAEGKAIDARTDIFSFGSVLYEMVTGQRAFQRETTLSTLSAILKEDPKPVSQVSAQVPPEVERVISRCLRKDPTRRFQHMDDLNVALEELLEETSSGKLAAVSVPRRQRLSSLVWASVLLLGLAAGLTAWMIYRTPRAAPMADPPRQLTFDPGLTTDPAFWPEGKLVAYASDREGASLDIWVQQMDTGDTRRLTAHAADEVEPSFSPDGSRIVYRSTRDGGGIYVLPTLGGEERKLADKGRGPRYSPDGKWVVYWAGQTGSWIDGHPSQIYITSAQGGAPRRLTDEMYLARQPVWSPDGKNILFIGRKREADALDFYLAPVDGGALKALGAPEKLKGLVLSEVQPLAWVGKKFYYALSSVDTVHTLALTLDPGNMELIGEPVTVSRSGGRERAASIAGGKLVYASVVRNSDIWLLPIQTNEAKPAGGPIRFTTDLSDDLNCSVSRDGTQLVYAAVRSGQMSVVLAQVKTKEKRILVSGPDIAPFPRINRDGTAVAYGTGNAERSDTHLIDLKTGAVSEVCKHCQLRSWSAGGPEILITTQNQTKLLEPFSGRQTLILGVFTNAPRTSSDREWVTFYLPEEAGRSRLWASPIRPDGATPKPKWIALSDGKSNDVTPELSPDDKTLYFVSDRDGFHCIWAQRLEAKGKHPAGAPIPIQHFHSGRMSPGYVRRGTRGFSVAENLIVFTMAEHTGNIWVADLPQVN